MPKFVFFHTPKPRNYVHKPIYWDPAKEEHDERQERVRKQLGHELEEGEKYKTSIKRGSFRQGIFGVADDSSDMKEERKKSNVRLVVILIILIIISALIYYLIGI